MHSSAKPTRAVRDQAGSLRELLRVAIPLVISSGATALMYLVDRVFLSWDSEEALAAALSAGVLHWNLAVLAIGTVGYANAFVAQYYGARQEHRFGPILWQSFYVALVFASAIMLCIPFAEQIFAWIGHDPMIQALEVPYFVIMCWGTAPLLVGHVLSCFYSGQGRTSPIMVVNILATLLNIMLDYLMIFGYGGFPAMGIRGAALATIISMAAVPVMYVVLIVTREQGHAYQLWSAWRPDAALTARLLKFGFPSGMQQFVDIAGWTIFVELIGRMSNDALSATSLVFNLNSIVFIPLLGLGTAVMSLAGQRVGEGRPQLAVRSSWLAFALASAYVVVCSSLYLLTPSLMLEPYGIAADGTVGQLVTRLLIFVAIYSLFDAMTVVFSSAIRGAGDTGFALWYSLTIGMLFLVLPTVVATSYGQEGFDMAWYSATAFISMLGVGFLARFQQGRWKSMRVIEPVDDETEQSLPKDQESPAVAKLAS